MNLNMTVVADKLRQAIKNHKGQTLTRTSQLMKAVSRMEQLDVEPVNIKVKNKRRKWEIASALQKAVRRGDRELMMKLVSAISTVPEWYAYFLRRTCVILAEESGPMNMGTLEYACLLYPIAAKKDLLDGKSFAGIMLSLLMMAIEKEKARDLCSLELISIYAKDSGIETEWEKSLIEIMQKSEFSEWGKKLNSLTSDLFGWLTVPAGTFDGLFDEQTKLSQELKTARLIGGLPEYAYDMHTRVGRRAINEFAMQKVAKEFPVLKGYCGENFVKLVQLCVFYGEGVLFDREQTCLPLKEFEHKVMFGNLGVEAELGEQIVGVVQEDLETEDSLLFASRQKYFKLEYESI